MSVFFWHCFLQLDFCTKLNFRYWHSNNLPIPGPTIKIIGDSAGTTTDVDGSLFWNLLENVHYWGYKCRFCISEVSVASLIKKSQ
jgi:hypothetical protein